MDIRYKSTRGNKETITSSQAILKGLAPDGGLYVPNKIPCLDEDLNELATKNYKEIAFIVLRKFLSDFTDEELKKCIEHAYDSKFDDEKIAPVKEVGDSFYLELFHGKTIAFKDMALSILPYLLTCAAKKNDITNEIIILTATSGDTGKAALAGFADVKGTKIVVFYPKGGVSKIQELQMVTQKGDNTKVVASIGNFDDCQTGVKSMFNDEELKSRLDKNNYQFSSANSINIGRLVPQIAYYVWSYLQLVSKGKIKAGEKINFCVPTGNFGNILAGYYAKLMGLPVNKLICASNDNKVLYDFFQSGTYDKNREFILTTSPSMDILISSNLERLIYTIQNEDEEKTKELMSELQTKGSYQIDKESNILKNFEAGFSTQEETATTIKEVYEKYNYVIDPHTAVASCVYEKYKKATNDNTPCVIVSTASPYKFARSVVHAIDKNVNHCVCATSKDKEYLGDFELIEELYKLSNVKIPQAIEDVLHADIRHNNTCELKDMEKEVTNFLGID